MAFLGGIFGKKKEGDSVAPAGKKSKDPVCGMMVDEAKAAATSTYEGQTYYFCAVGCKKSFDADPAKYLKGNQAGSPMQMRGD